MTRSSTTTRSCTTTSRGSTLRAHGDAIALKPGVAHGLARLAGLLKPALEIMWVDDVRRMNKFLDAEVPDVAGHLFGRERTALAAVREPFKEAFGPHCFYCGTHLPANNPIDHVLPWSLVGIDGLANLVLACARCNGDKSGALPAVAIVDRVLTRDREVLEEIAAEMQWPTQHDRVVAAARGSIAGSRPESRRGRATSGASGWTSVSRRGGRTPTDLARQHPTTRGNPIARCRGQTAAQVEWWIEVFENLFLDVTQRIAVFKGRNTDHQMVCNPCGYTRVTRAVQSPFTGWHKRKLVE